MSDTGSPSSEPTPEPPTNIVRKPSGPNDNWPDFSTPAGGSAPRPAPPRPTPGPGYPPAASGPGYGQPGPAYPQQGSGPANPQAGSSPGYPQAGYGQPGPRSGPGQVAPYGHPGPPAPPAQPGYPQPGYGQSGPGYPPPGYGGPGYPGGPGPLRPSQPNDTNMAMLAHLGGIIFGFIPGLIVYLMKKDESPWARKQGAEALNFQLTLIIPTIICIVLTFVLVGFFLLIALNIFRIVMCIMASTAASRGEPYEYPSWIRINMVS